MLRRAGRAIKNAAATVLEQTAEVLDRTREAMEEAMTREPDPLVPGSWGGDAKGFDKVGDTLAVGFNQQQAAVANQIEVAHKQREAIARLEEQAAQGSEEAEAKLERIAQLARERAIRQAKAPKPIYKKPNTDVGGGLVEGMAEEGVRHQAIAKQKHVQTDSATAARIAGQTPGLSGVTPLNEQQPPRQVAPGLQQPQPQVPAPSRLALKRRPPEFQAGNALITIGMIREQVENGQIDAGIMLDLAEAASELQYALATSLKSQLTG